MDPGEIVVDVVVDVVERKRNVRELA